MNAPMHIPADRIRDVNIYALPGQEADFHAAWKALQDSSPDLIWTPQNEGHWIAMRSPRCNPTISAFRAASSCCPNRWASSTS
jgi:hypothetical protein